MEEFNNKVEVIENEMDIRVQSLIMELHEYRDGCRRMLENSKEEFQK